MTNLNPTKWLGALALCLLVLTDDLPASADSWQIVDDKSSIRFQGDQTGAAFEGEFEKFRVQIDFDPNDLTAATVRAEIDIASAITGDPQRDTAMPGKDWFWASNFPVATFTAQGFEQLGDNRFSTRGSLTIRGIRKEIAFPFTLSINKGVANMSSEITLVRSDYGIGSGPWAEGKWVAIPVRVLIDIEAVRLSEE